MSKKQKADVQPFLADGSDWKLSLSKFVGQKITDITGYPSCPFDEFTPVFKIHSVVFEDGTEVFVEGEHDTPYIPADDKLKNMDEKTLQSFIEE